MHPSLVADDISDCICTVGEIVTAIGKLEVPLSSTTTSINPDDSEPLKLSDVKPTISTRCKT